MLHFYCFCTWRACFHAICDKLKFPSFLVLLKKDLMKYRNYIFFFSGRVTTHCWNESEDGRFSESQSSQSRLQSEAQISLYCVHCDNDPSVLVWNSMHESDVDWIVVLVMARIHSRRFHLYTDFVHKRFETCLSRLRLTPGSNVFPQQVHVVFQACAGTGGEHSTLMQNVLSE